jgi:hypothetical protein
MNIGTKTRWPWALAAALVSLIAVFVFGRNPCYFEGDEYLVAGLVLAWFLAFTFLGKWARVNLCVIAFVALYFFPRGEFTPSAEAAAVSTLLREATALRSYSENHPEEGYPATPPPFRPRCRARNVYEFRYSRESSERSPVADRFTLIAVPTIDRGLRSFAATEDGALHVADSELHRPASRVDKELK